MTYPIRPDPTPKGSLWRRQPVRVWASVQSLSTAVIAMLIGFDLIDWTIEQQGLVLAVIAAVGGVVGVRVSGQVTTTAYPRDDTGRPLVPLTLTTTPIKDDGDNYPGRVIWPDEDRPPI